MFRSYWITTIALGLTLFVGSPAPHAQPIPQQKPIIIVEEGNHHSVESYTNLPEQNGNTTVSPLVEEWAIDGVDSSLATDPESEKHDSAPRCEFSDVDGCNRSTQQSMANSTRSMMYAAWVGVAFTALGICLLWQTLNATRDIGQTQVRAYLSSKRGEYIVEYSAERFRCSLFATNHGQSPATDITATYCLAFEDVDKTGREGRTRRIEGITPLGCVAPIPAGISGEIPLNMSLIKIAKESDSFVSHIGDVHFPFWILGTLSWKDVFGMSQSIDFTLTHEDMPHGNEPGTLSADNRKH